MAHIVYLIESERGWGTKVDEVKTFETYDEAMSYVEEFNKDYDFYGATPDYYYIAQYRGEDDAS